MTPESSKATAVWRSRLLQGFATVDHPKAEASVAPKTRLDIALITNPRENEAGRQGAPAPTQARRCPYARDKRERIILRKRRLRSSGFAGSRRRFEQLDVCGVLPADSLYRKFRPAHPWRGPGSSCLLR